MSIKPLLLSLFVPPTCFMYLAAAGLIASSKFPGRGRGLIWFALVGLFVCSMPAISGKMIAELEQNLPRIPPRDAPPQAIVILGGDLQRTAEPPYALPGDLSFSRLRAGADLWRRVKLPILVTGGIVQPDRPPIADIMVDSLHGDFHVPVEWVENRSHTTWENATLSAPILKQHGISSIYLVTNAWHMRRALIAFRRAGITVTAEPTSIDVSDLTEPNGFIPESRAFDGIYFAFHEWVGCAWYDIR